MRARLFLLLPLLAACNSTPSATTEQTAAQQENRQGADSATAALPAPDTASRKAVSAVSDTLRQVRQLHSFSQPQGPPDVFRLVFRGPSILEGTGEFTITDATGQVIFREMLTEPDLEAALVYEMKTPLPPGPSAKPSYCAALTDFSCLPSFIRPPWLRKQPSPPASKTWTAPLGTTCASAPMPSGSST